MNAKYYYKIAKKLGFNTHINNKYLKEKGLIGAYIVLCNELQRHYDLIAEYEKTKDISHHIKAIELHKNLLNQLFKD